MTRIFLYLLPGDLFERRGLFCLFRQDFFTEYRISKKAGYLIKNLNSKGGGKRGINKMLNLKNLYKKRSEVVGEAN